MHKPTPLGSNARFFRLNLPPFYSPDKSLYSSPSGWGTDKMGCCCNCLKRDGQRAKALLGDEKSPIKSLKNSSSVLSATYSISQAISDLNKIDYERVCALREAKQPTQHEFETHVQSARKNCAEARDRVDTRAGRVSAH